MWIHVDTSMGDIAHLAVADVNEGGDRPTQVQQRVHLHRRLGRTKRCPIEQTQTQVESRFLSRLTNSLRSNIVADRGLAGVGIKGQPDAFDLANIVELVGAWPVRGLKVNPTPLLLPLCSYSTLRSS